MPTANLARLVDLAHRRNLGAQARVAALADEVAVLDEQRDRVARYALDYRPRAAAPEVLPGARGLRARHAMASGLDDRLTGLDEAIGRKRDELEGARDEHRRERGSESALAAMLERAAIADARRGQRIEAEEFDAVLALRLRAEHLRERAARAVTCVAAQPTRTLPALPGARATPRSTAPSASVTRARAPAVGASRMAA